MQEIGSPTLSSSPVVKNPTPETPVKPLIEETKTSASSPEKKRTLPTLPLLRAELLKSGITVPGEGFISLYAGTYDQRAVTIQQVSSQILTGQRGSLVAFAQLASPFWLRVIGICEGVSESSWVTASLPSTSFETYLSSPAAESWINRCRLVRDVAVGVYQRRALGATHIAWYTHQLYLDQEGRAQLFPFISEKPVAETDDVFALGQLIWQVASRSTVLMEGWQTGKGLPRDCPPEVLALIQTCTDPIVSARPSLKTLAKGLDAFWQRAGVRLPDPVPSVSLEISQDKKEKKYEPVPTLQSKEIVTGLYSGSSASVLKLEELKKTTPIQPREFQHSLQDNLSPDSSPSSTQTDIKEQKNERPAPKPSQSIAPSMLDSALSTGSLNILLIDDQTVGWLDPADPRYCVGVKLCSVRDHFKELSESKASLSELQDEIQHTLLSSPIEVLLWVGEDGEDPGAPLAETSRRLWQAPEWQAYRPGDSPPTTWLPLLVNVHQQNITSALFIHCHQPPTETADFTEAEWRELHSHYELFWLVQGADKLTEPCNLYEANELYRAAGQTRLVLHTETSAAYKLEESTYLMPHDAEGRSLPARYTRYATDSGFSLTTWKGCYQGAIGSQAVDSTSLTITLTPNKDLSLTRSALKYDESQTPLGKGAFGEVLRGTYHGQAVAVKRFNKTTLSSSDKAQLRDEAAVMANLHSDFLVHLLGLSLDNPPLLVMELAQGGSVYSLLKDSSKELPWSTRFRLLRDISLGLATLHAHELLHRDLKSPNILLDADGRAKLCDFGLSTLKSQAKKTREVGTLLWNAPEVLQEKAATPASDIYSFAMVCWEVATRRLPYQTLSWKNEVVQQIQKGQREIIPNDCPPALAKIIAACWSQDPNERPIANQLAHVLEGLWQEAVIAEQHASLLQQSSLDTKRRQVPTPIAEPLLPTQRKASITSEENFPSLLTAGSPGYLFNTKTAPSTQTPSETKHIPAPVLDSKAVQFTSAQMQDYIDKYVTEHRDDPDPPKDWDAARYKKEFAAFPKLQTLIDTPFMLWMTLSILPSLASEQAQSPEKNKDELKEKKDPDKKDVKESKQSTVSRPKITRAALYDRFMEGWFTRQARKAWQARSYLKNPAVILGKPNMQAIKEQASQIGSEDVQVHWFLHSYRAFCLAFAQQLTLTGQVSARHEQDKEIKGKNSPWEQLLGDTPDGVRLRQGCPLRESSDHTWSFIHASLLDYFLTTAIAEALLLADSTPSGENLFTLTHAQAVALLSRAHLTPEQVRFFADRVKTNVPLQEALFEVIERSKVDSTIAIASANAATVLNACGIPFTGRDWQKVQLPRANLSYGQLAYTDLRGANLRGATLMRTILYRANLQAADLREVRWGEWTRLQLEKGVEAMAQHPTRPWLAVGQGENVVLLDTETGERIGVPLSGHKGDVTSVSFSPHGQRLVSGGGSNYYWMDSTVRLWDVEKRKAVGKPLTGHTNNVTSVSFSPDGRHVVSGGGYGDNTVRLWDVETQQALGAPLAGHTDSVMSVSFSPDGRRVVSGSWDNTVRLWDVETQQALGAPLTGHMWRVSSVSFSPNGRRVVSGSWDRTLRLWDVDTQQTLGEGLTGHTNAVTSVSFSPDGRRVVSGSRDNTVRLWDVETQQALGAPLIGHTCSVSTVSFSGDGRQIVSGSNDKTVHLWDVEIQQALGSAPFEGHTGGVSLSFSPDGRQLVSGSEDRTLRLWDVETQQALDVLEWYMSSVTSVFFSPDGRRIVAVSGGHTVLLWDVDTQQAIGAPLTGHTHWVNCVSFSPDGRRLVSGSSDNTLRLWDVETQQALGAPLIGHTWGVYSVSFSPNGRRVVSGSWDKTVRLWDVDTQQAVGAPLRGHTNKVYSVSFSPDGRHLVSGSCDDTVYLWDVETQQALSAPFTGHTNAVSSVSFSSDGRRLISGSVDQTLRLWDIASHQCVAVMHWHQAIKTLAIMRPKTPFTTLNDPDSKSSRRLTSTVSTEEDLLAVNDGFGTISFWAVSQKEASIRFLGMPCHSAMPLLVDGIALQGCRMDPTAKRLLAQYRAEVDEVVVEVAEEKQKKSTVTPKSFSTISGKPSSTRPLIQQPSLETKRRQAPTPIAEPLSSTQQKTLVSSSVTSEQNFPSLLTAGSPGYLFNTKTAPTATNKDRLSSRQSLGETKHTPAPILGDSKAASSQHGSEDQEDREVKVSHDDDTQPSLTGTSASAFKILLAQSPPPRWQDKLSPHYTLSVKIQCLRQKVLADPFIIQELSCYIAPNGQSQPGQPSDPLYPWVERELLQGNAQVLVLQGMGGAGKSTFNRHLLRTLWQDSAWQAYRPGDPAPKAPMPVWIPLGSGQVKPNDLWDYYHHLPEIDGFTTAEIAVLKKDYQLIWLADGYDEIPGQAAPNLYDLNQLGDYPVKLVIGCRSQRLQTLSEADALVPHPTGTLPSWPLYRTRHVALFTPAQTQDYINKYVAQHRDDPDRPKDWDAARYKKEFAAFPELQTLIHTPFMLWMTLSILPSLASEQAQSPEKNKHELKEKKDQDKKEVKESKQSTVSRSKITRSALYDRFMGGWFTRQARKAWQARSYLKNPAVILGKPNMQAIKEQASQVGSEDVQVLWLKHAYRTFCLILAQQLTQAGQVSVRYEKDKEVKGTTTDTGWEAWEAQLLGDRMPDSARMRQGCPLRESSDHAWSFMHASLLDYFLTTAIVEALLLADSTLSSGNLFTFTHVQAVALLSGAHLTTEQVRFFADRVETNIPLQEALFKVIECSKVDSTIAIASANAATVLNACEIAFSGRDWQNVQLPGADLSYGQLAYTNLRGANLRGATLMRAILYQANFQAADLRDVRWGEWPRLHLEEQVYAVAQHPIQPWLAVGQGKNIVLLHTEIGERIGVPLSGHMDVVMSVSFSPDGRRLVSGSIDNTLRLWDVETQQALRAPLTGHTGRVTSVSFSPDGRRLISGSEDATLRLWDVETQQALGAPLTDHTSEVRSVSFSPDGRQIVSGSKDETVRLWDVETQQALGVPLTGHTKGVTSVSFSPDGRRVVSGSWDQTVRLWDVDTQQSLGAPLTGHTHWVMSVSFSPDGRRLVSGSEDNTVRLWDVDTQQPLGAPLTGHTGRVSSASFSPDGRRLISGSRDNTVRLWDVETQQALGAPLTDYTSEVRSVSFSPDGRRIISGSADSTVRLWDVDRQKAVGKPLTGHTGEVTSVSFSPDGRQLVSGSHDNSVRLWDVETQQALGTPLEGHTNFVNSVSFSPDGRRLLSGSGDFTVRLWDVETQQALGAPLIGHTNVVTSVSFSPDGRCLISGSLDNTVRLWDVETQQTVGKPLTGHTDTVMSVSFSPDGWHVVSGGGYGDNTVRLWDVDTQQAEGAPLTGHTKGVNSVSFTPDGRRVVSGSWDQTVRLWDIESHQCVVVMHWHQEITTVAIIHPKTPFTTLNDPDSKSSRRLTSTVSAKEDLLAIGDEIGTISFWAVSQKKASIRFLGMPRHSTMPLLVDGIALQGCRMDPMAKRLLAQYRAEVDKVVVEVAEEKEKKSTVMPKLFPTLSGKPSSTSSIKSTTLQQQPTPITPTSLTQTVQTSTASPSLYASSSAFFSTASSSPAITSDKTNIKAPQLDEKKRKQPIPLQNELTKACEEGSLPRVKAAIGRGAVAYPLYEGDKHPLYCAVYGMNPEVVRYLIEQRDTQAPPINWYNCEKHNKIHYGRTFLNMNFDPCTYRDWYDLLIQIETNEFLTGHHLVQVKKLLGGSSKNYASFKALKGAVAQWKVRIVGLGEIMRERGFVEDAYGQTELKYKASRHQIKQMVDALQLKEVILETAEEQEVKSKQPTPKTKQTLQTTVAASTVTTSANSFTAPSLSPQSESQTQGGLPRSRAFLISQGNKALVTSSSAGKKSPIPSTHYSQLFPPVPDKKIPVSMHTPSLPKVVLLEQAHALLDTACPPQNTHRAELRRGFLKQLVEYEQTGPMVPLTSQQQLALEELLQTLREMQPSQSQTSTSSTFHG